MSDVKIAALTAKIETLEQEMGELKGIIDGKTRLKRLVAETGQFMVPPLEMAFFGSTTYQSVASGSYQAIEFNNEFINTGLVSWDSGTPSTFELPPYANRAIYLMYVNFIAQSVFSSGIRARFEIISTPSTWYGVFSYINTSLSWSNYSGFYAFAWEQSDTQNDKSFELQLHQDSGSPQNIFAQLLCLRVL